MSTPRVLTPEKAAELGLHGIEVVKIPEGEFDEIGEAAFKGQTQIKEIFVPQGITKAQKHAFDGCIHLEKFHWPSSMKTTMPYAFNDCGIATEKSARDAKHEPSHVPTPLR